MALRRVSFNIRVCVSTLFHRLLHLQGHQCKPGFSASVLKTPESGDRLLTFMRRGHFQESSNRSLVAVILIQGITNGVGSFDCFDRLLFLRDQSAFPIFKHTLPDSIKYISPSSWAVCIAVLFLFALEGDEAIT